MKRGTTHKTASGDRMRAGRFPSGFAYSVRKAGKASQKMGAPETKIKIKGPSGDYVTTREKKGEVAKEKYHPSQGFKNSGTLASKKIKSTFGPRKIKGGGKDWPNTSTKRVRAK